MVRDPPDVPATTWAVRLTHPAWGEAVVVAPRGAAVPDADLIRWGTHSLTADERELVGRAETVAGRARDHARAQTCYAPASTCCAGCTC